ncbi:unnamed protein product [Moneuplotes crassus]|uniref:histone deacetylase n=1 Tax=Euplotes crassus TaxID=5936 RepID=A0AAD1ULJ9_EUPCR|nr:unnamed protein product [Moneuplotes crassus]
METTQQESQDETKKPEELSVEEEKAKHELALYYNERVKLHPNNKEELRERCELIYTNLKNENILKSKMLTQPTFELIPVEYLAKIHSQSLIDKVLSFEEYDENIITSVFGEDNYENKHTTEAARIAAGGAYQAMKDVLSSTSTVKSAFALVRPPGHHSCVSETDGYCFFNNAAVAATYAKELFGLKKILILDWDVHHGDGTQEIFYNDPEVFYMSMHRWENGIYFPSKETSNYTFTGGENAKGFNLNIPWNTTKTILEPSSVGTKEYKYLFENLLFGIIEEYAPEFIILSAGFDSAKGDPLGQQQVEHEFYYWACQNLQKLCPKIMLLLEGGYNKYTIVNCSTLCVQALMGYEKAIHLEDSKIEDILPEAIESIKNAASAHSEYWNTAKTLTEQIGKE